MKRAGVYLTVYVAGLAVWLAGLSSPAYAFQWKGYVYAYPFIKAFYNLTCHQETAKTFGADYGGLLVCARCFGIYSGAALGLPILPLIAKFNFVNKKIFYILLAFPMLADVAAISLGLWQYAKPLAFSTGFSAGTGITFLILTFMKQRRELQTL